MNDDSNVVVSFEAAEAQMIMKATRRYRGKDVKAIEDAVAKSWAKVAAIGRRLLDASADLGLALEALKQQAPQGTYLDRLQRLGIARTTAQRLRDLAVYREQLPAEPPAELYGSIWTAQAAIEYGRTLAAMQDDLAHLEPTEAHGRVVKHLRANRTIGASGKLAGDVAKVFARLRQALHDGEPGAQGVLAQLKAETEQLDHLAKSLTQEVKVLP